MSDRADAPQYPLPTDDGIGPRHGALRRVSRSSVAHGVPAARDIRETSPSWHARGCAAWCILLAVVVSGLPAAAQDDAPERRRHGEDVVMIADLRLKLVKIPAGTFKMGSRLSPAETVAQYDWVRHSGLEDEHPRHAVTLTQSIWIGVTEVTQRQF